MNAQQLHKHMSLMLPITFDYFPLQDNLLDLELAKQGPDPKDMEEKVIKISSVMDELQTRFARLLAEQEAVQAKLKKRITKLEKKITASSGELEAQQPSLQKTEDAEK